MRFVYCACAISYMLDDWSGVDMPAVVRYVNACLVRASPSSRPQSSALGLTLTTGASGTTAASASRRAPSRTAGPRTARSRRSCSPAA